MAVCPVWLQYSHPGHACGIAGGWVRETPLTGRRGARRGRSGRWQRRPLHRKSQGQGRKRRAMGPQKRKRIPICRSPPLSTGCLPVMGQQQPVAMGPRTERTTSREGAEPGHTGCTPWLEDSPSNADSGTLHTDSFTSPTTTFCARQQQHSSGS